MSHPPICPKSEMFFQEDSGETYMQFPDETSDFAWACNIAFSNGYERRVAAAFAEVEWRKREERWSALWRRVLGRSTKELWGTGSHHRKTLRYQMDRASECGAICEDIADQWRAWADES